MRIDIAVTINQATKETKGLSVLATKHLKTRTDLSYTANDKDKDQPLPIEAVDDIRLLKLEGAPVASILLTVEGVKSFGRMINRSVNALARVGLALGEGAEPVGWDDDSGVVAVSWPKDIPIVGADLPFLLEVLTRMIGRANGGLSGTQHPMTFFDLKQAIGVVYGVKAGDPEAQELDQWLAPRELIYLEEKKAEAKAKAKVAREREKAITKENVAPGVTKEKVGKSQPATTKPKTKGKANLGNLT